MVPFRIGIFAFAILKTQLQMPIQKAVRAHRMHPYEKLICAKAQAMRLDD
jgi:hypothetical protein